MLRLYGDSSRSYPGRPVSFAVSMTTGAGLRPIPKGMEKPPDPTVVEAARLGVTHGVRVQESAEAIVSARSGKGPNTEKGRVPMSSHDMMNQPRGVNVRHVTEQPDPDVTLQERILSRENMLRAWHRVKENKGAPGILRESKIPRCRLSETRES